MLPVLLKVAPYLLPFRRLWLGSYTPVKEFPLWPLQREVKNTAHGKQLGHCQKLHGSVVYSKASEPYFQLAEYSLNNHICALCCGMHDLVVHPQDTMKIWASWMLPRNLSMKSMRMHWWSQEEAVEVVTVRGMPFFKTSIFLVWVYWSWKILRFLKTLRS